MSRSVISAVSTLGAGRSISHLSPRTVARTFKPKRIQRDPFVVVDGQRKKMNVAPVRQVLATKKKPIVLPQI